MNDQNTSFSLYPKVGSTLAPKFVIFFSPYPLN